MYSVRKLGFLSVALLVALAAFLAVQLPVMAGDAPVTTTVTTTTTLPATITTTVPATVTTAPAPVTTTVTTTKPATVTTTTPATATTTTPPPAVEAKPPAESDGVVGVAPLPALAGTCIRGNIINSLEMATGEGLTVNLAGPNGMTASVKAGKGGDFAFENLAAGDYTLSLAMPDGATAVTSGKFTVTLDGKKTSGCARVRFKIQEPGTIEIWKFDIHGPKNMPIGLAGWEFTVTKDNVSFTCVTDWSGKCVVTGLGPGTWKVAEKTQVGWDLVSPGTNPVSVVVESRKTTVIKFFNRQIDKGTIEVRKSDPSGGPLAGWMITVTRDDGTQPPRMMKTDANGMAFFSGLALGQWTVKETMQPGWLPTSPTAQAVTLDTPGQHAMVEFQNQPSLCISGWKINQFDQGLPDWTIRARNAETSEVFTATTGAKGFFVIDGLTPGVWNVAEELQPGWTAVTPDNMDVVLKASDRPQPCQVVRFKNKTDLATIDVFKRDLFQGVGLPDWQITLKPAFGGTPTVQTTNGQGWTRFDGLVPGFYSICETAKTGWAPVTPACQTINVKATGSASTVIFINRQIGKMPPKIDHQDKGKIDHKDNKPVCEKFYGVVRGDTLTKIGAKFHVSVMDLQKANGLKGSLIFSGQKLCIPPDP